MPNRDESNEKKPPKKAAAKKRAPKKAAAKKRAARRQAIDRSEHAARDEMREVEKTRVCRVHLTGDEMRKLALLPAMFRQRRTVIAGRELVAFVAELAEKLEGLEETETFIDRVRVDPEPVFDDHPDVDTSPQDEAFTGEEERDVA